MKTLLSAGLVFSAALLVSCSTNYAPKVEQKPNIDGETLSGKPAIPAETPIRKFAKDAQGSFACGLYLNGKKVGYLVGTSKVVKRGDTEFFEQKMETLISAAKDGKKFSDKSTLTRLFNLDGNGQLYSIEQVSERDGATHTNTVIKQGDKYLETSSSGARSIQIEPPKTNLDNDKQLSDWLDSSPKPGDKFDYKESDFSGGEFNEQISHYKYIAKTEMTLKGVPTTIHSVEQSDDRNDDVTEFDCDSKGRIIRGSIGPIQVRMEEESTARKLNAQVEDWLKLSAVPTNVRMGDPTKLKQVLLRISGIKYNVPNSHRQIQTADGKGGRTTLVLLRDFKSPDKEVLNKEQLKKYLKATSEIQSDNAKIKTFAQRIVEGQTDPIKKAELLQKAIYLLLEKNANRNSTTALEVLECRAGDCTEHALLFNTLARAAGIPSREVTGLMYTQAPKPVFYWHAWNEIYDGERWISVDATWDEVFVDAGHLKIENDEENSLKLLNSLGNMKIEILSFQTAAAISTKDAFVSPEKSQSMEKELVLMDHVPPPPPALHAQLKEAPPAVNIEMSGMANIESLNAAARPRAIKKDLGKPIQQFSGGKLHQVQFDKQGHQVE